MAEIIKLDDLVPDDIVFVYQGEEYIVPGDLDTETVFKVFKHLRAVVDARPAEGETIDEETARRAAKSLHDLLLEVFQVRKPEMRGPLPFGARSIPIITERLLRQIGVDGSTIQAEEAEEEPIPTGRASRSQKKSSPASASRRSTGKS